ncbi:MAG: hypothetical protein FJZ01_15820 [Candidatus Sericytochromatia bacterium]|nr:hypothetical protein [Candidatus Tanganyikabacteria bacterium]
MRPSGSKLFWAAGLPVATFIAAVSACKVEEPAVIPVSTPAPVGIRNPGAPELVATTTRQLAPGDTGDLKVTHDLAVVKGAATSSFVWIPEFVAYQLIVPARTSTDSAYPPAGAWVREKPPVGTAGADWATASFGGFYVAKYEASRADAVAGTATSSAGATAGASTSLKVAPYCVPWTNVDWDEARRACQAYDAKADLIGDEEWTALAVWASITSTESVRGNNSFLRDKDRPDITFVGDATYGGGRALTGSATSSAWTGTQNFTAHTLTTAGAYDLNGNVFEWTRTLGLDEKGKLLVDGTAATWRLPNQGSGHIAALASDEKLRLLGVPTETAPAPNAYFSAGFFFVNPTSFVKPFRGGSWSGAQRSGIWYVALGYPRSYSYADLGFRPILKY